MPRKQHKYHYIYITTCLVNGKYYIGMHSTDDLDDNYLGSGKSLKRSLNKYGRFSHSIEVIEFLPNRKDLIKREKEIVNIDLLNDSKCMNLVIGGEGGEFISKEQQRINGKNTAAKIWNNLEYRKNHSIIQSKRMRKLAEELHGSPVKNYQISFLNKNHSSESKRKIGLANSEKQKGSNNSQFGTCWITNDILNKKIKQSELEAYIALGWRKGRIS